MPTINVTLTSTELALWRRCAKVEQRSMSNWVNVHMNEYLKRPEAPNLEPTPVDWDHVEACIERMIEARGRPYSEVQAQEIRKSMSDMSETARERWVEGTERRAEIDRHTASNQAPAVEPENNS